MRTRNRKYSFPRNRANHRSWHSSVPDSPHSVVDFTDNKTISLTCARCLIFCTTFTMTVVMLDLYCRHYTDCGPMCVGAWLNAPEPVKPTTLSLLKMLVERGKFLISMP